MSEGSPATRRHHWVRNGILSLAVLIVVLEVGLRFVLGNMDAAPFQLHPGDGRCVGLRPGGVSQYTGWFRRIPEVRHDVNRWGYRGTAYPPGPGTGESRIVVLGDSFTFGQGVADDQTMPAHLESILRGSEAGNIRVLNFGIPGLNLAEMIDQYRNFARRWTADLVLLVLFDNDLDAPLCSWIGNPVVHWGLRNIYVYRALWGLYTYWSLERDRSPPATRERKLVEELARLRTLVANEGSRLAVVVLMDPLESRERFDADATTVDVPYLYLGDERRGSLEEIPGEHHLSSLGNQRFAELTAPWLDQLLADTDGR